MIKIYYKVLALIAIIGLAANATANQGEKNNLDCDNDRQKMLLIYNELMTKGDYSGAGNSIRICAKKTGKLEFINLLREADKKRLLKTLEDKGLEKSERAKILLFLSEKYPELGDGYAKESQRITKELNQKAAEEDRKIRIANEAAEKKRKKSEGVRIGMNQEDVLASSWGRPNNINRTTNVHGIKEQWVYEGRNYLYFTNGILTSIQN